ncbi:D-2-hydroxyacid dehydrogenase [Akkermansiaceae bacterium]|nr:D-2-hydroxyacid dehydrogenase [Akkermansiaceae bacterium]
MISLKPLAIFSVITAFSSSIVFAETGSKALADQLGSLDNSQIAIPMKDGKKKVTFFAKNFSPEDKATLAELAPNLNLVVGLSNEEVSKRIAEADGIDARYISQDLLKQKNNIKWVQAPTAGVDKYLGGNSPLKGNDIILTNFRGVHGPSIADHAMALLLFQARNLSFYADNQKKEVWDRETFPKPAITLKGKTMMVIGLGGIGTEIAKRAHGFEMRVIGTRRSDSPSPEFIEKVGKPQDLLKMLPEADVVVLAVPLTSETKHMMNKEAFAAMKDGSYLINIARGAVVKTEALIEALNSGKLAGAGIDVTDPEPLHKGHSLWKAPNLIITPHVSGKTEITKKRRSALTVENLRRFASGEPLLNVVDKEAGY